MSEFFVQLAKYLVGIPFIAVASALLALVPTAFFGGIFALVSKSAERSRTKVIGIAYATSFAVIFLAFVSSL